jgi:hypothetical protein
VRGFFTLPYGAISKTFCASSVNGTHMDCAVSCLPRAAIQAGTPAGPGYAARLAVGTLLVPGTIILYAQPEPPWVLTARLQREDEARLARAGAVLEMLGHGHHTIVHWPAATLRDFMLFDGLMHELAHHTIQQYKGKRAMRVLRTADHEAIADRFAQKCRLRYLQYEECRCENGAS